MEQMTVDKIFEMEFIEDYTKIIIRDDGLRILAHGNWYQDDILGYACRKVKSFIWKDNNVVFINVI